MIKQLKLFKTDGFEPTYQFGTSDYKGRIYFILKRIGNTGESFICRINDINDETIQFLFPFSQYAPNAEIILDITFVKDRIYILEGRNSKIIVCDTSFNRIGEITDLKYLVTSFLSYSTSCDETKTLAFHCSKNPFDMSPFCSDTLFISSYDFVTNIFTPYCSIKMTSRDFSIRPSSSLEFLSSDPECDLLIDLDRDNSSGLYPYDYRYHSTICSERIVFIADSDLYIHTSIPLDSIILTLHGGLDGVQEILKLGVSISGMLLYKISDTVYVLKGPANTADSIYRKALGSIQYTHMSDIHTPGVRKIEVQGISVVKAGVKIYSYISVGAGVLAIGNDTAITICTDTKIAKLNDLVHAKNGFWSPSLNSKTDAFDSNLDLANKYQYISGDSICGMDTAEITITRGMSFVPTEIMVDTSICQGSNLSFGGLVYADTGMYQLIIPSATGCDSLIYTIHLSHSDIPPATIQSDSQLCEGGTIVLSVDNIYNSYTWSFGNIDIAISNFVVTDKPGSYVLSTRDKYNCLSSDTFQVILHPRPGIHARDMTGLDFVPNRSVDISYEGMIAAYSWLPPSGLSCSDCAVPFLLDDKDRIYSISVISDAGCKDSSNIEVGYKRTQYYIPNIVSTNSTTNQNTFYLRSNTDYIYDMEIFDRWGHIVFSNFNLQMNNPSGSWNPTYTNTPPAVYVYKFVIHTTAGNVLKAGDVTVVR
ncbi:MAG: hypothetical protein ABI844_07125 [Saprospiraceae bacterium]